MASPSLSVIIPTFNVAAKIADSLRSVLDDQAPFEPVEVLVMDGASTDGTVEIAREWAARDTRVQVWSEPDEGVYDAMNKGIARATGGILYFLGAGDIVKPGVFRELGQMNDLHPLLLLYGKVWIKIMEAERGTAMTRVDMARRTPCHQGIFYGREIFQRVGLYDVRYPIHADHELNWKCWTTPAIETRYWDKVIADFENGGLSATGHDAAFERDWPWLVWKRGGPTAWICYQLSARFTPEKLVLLRRLRSSLKAAKP